MTDLNQAIKKALEEAGSEIEFAVLRAFIAVESGGKGFDGVTGKILIQFEPHHFRRISGRVNGQIWPANKIDVQSKEWKAFNEAFRIDPDAAMQATSIGLPQIMGFHWKRLGYSSVGAMWDDFKSGIVNQIKALIKFIDTDPRLKKAILEKDWHKIAYYYNGAGYAAQAHRNGYEPYNFQMKKAYENYRVAE